ncbi:hypothetical protein M9458_020933, partial [Cirrhinus mrigala]
EEELQDGRLHFSGYNTTSCVKDGTAVKNAQMDANPPPAVLRDSDVNRRKIDTISRAAFPLAFLIFNVFYWITYKIIRHESAGKT